jgi:hypothetical protein
VTIEWLRISLRQARGLTTYRALGYHEALAGKKTFLSWVRSLFNAFCG